MQKFVLSADNISGKMTSGQKIAFSLLAALALFAVFVVSLNSRLFSELETRFYAQAKIEENTGQLDKISESCDSYISEILSLIEKGENAWVKNASVRSYYVQNPSEADVNQRRRLTESLFSEIPALTGIRIVDKNGRNVHYSSFDDTDLLKQSGITKIYKNYNDITKDADEIPFETLQKVTSETKAVLLFDESHKRLVLSEPFCWVDGIYSGLALFYLNSEAISASQGFTLFSDDDYNGGFVLNLPYGKKADFRQPLLDYWKNKNTQLEKLLVMPDGRFYVALSSNRPGKIRISGIYTSDVFELSAEIRVLIYICIFISILLIVFLIFSFIRDPMVTLKKRVKKIQLEIIENHIDGKEKREWGDVARHLRLRKKDLSDEIIKSLHVHSKKRRKEVSDYLDKNWDEIFSIFETRSGSGSETSAGGAAAGTAGTAELTGASIAEIRRMLEEVLQNRSLAVPVTAAVAASVPKPAAKAKVETVEALDDVDELDEVEEIDEAEEVEDLAEDIDEVEELEEPEEVEELAEEADEVEELAEEAEEVEELAEDIDEAEEVEELAEDVDDAEEVEELAEDVDEVEEVEELAEEADEVEELEEEVEDLDEEVEELDGEEELEELESAEDEVDALIKSMAPPPLDFVPSNETYFETENFASVENLFAEELKLGNFDPYFMKGASTIEITIYPLPDYETSEQTEEAAEETEPQVEEVSEVQEEPEVLDTVEEEASVEELTEEVPDYLPEPDFSMTSFGDNLSDDVPELQEENVIIEQDDGVFSIAENLEYTDVVQDEDFKSLVDSVL